LTPTESNAGHPTSGVEGRARFLAPRLARYEEATIPADEQQAIETGAWRASLAGPPVLGHPPGDMMPTVEEYAGWLAELPPVAVPATGPRFSVIVPVYNPSAEHLTACIRSMRAQTYGNWELVLVDASDAVHVAPIIGRFTAVDHRIHAVRTDNQGIAANTNVGVAASCGSWIAFLDHDDVLAPDALAALASAIVEAPDADFVYSDEDKLDEEGRYREPFFKPDWSPHLLRTVNYIAHLVALPRVLFDDVGGIRTGFEGAQDYDFVLRATSRARTVVHLPRILYHWRQHPLSTASDVLVKPDAHGAGRRALQDWASEHAPGASIGLGAGATSHRVRMPLRPEKVSIIVPFKDRPQMTEQCLRAIERCAGELAFEVLLVSNASREQATHRAIERWRQLPFVRVEHYDEPFNFQRLNNWAAGRTDGPLLVFLNNDTEPLHQGWLEALAEYAQQPDVGAVGARLFYPDGTVQHAGVAVGIGGLAEHPWAHLAPDAVTPAGPSYWVRDVTAVTAACLMVRREVFESVGGFDERFIVCGGDVDLGIRLRQAGYWNVFTPFARLLHHESATRPRRPPDSDVQESLRSYATLLRVGDPFYNASLTRADTTCRLELPPVREPSIARRR
jgi:O-antigen biosynthesis protein